MKYLRIIKYYLKTIFLIIYGYFENKSKYKKYNHKTVFFIGVAEYGNFGDQAITLAEEKYIKSYMNNPEIVFIPENQWYQNIINLKIFTNKYNNLCISPGGGNMGELYTFQENIRLSAVKNLKNAKIIVFPQSIDYKIDSVKAKKARKIYEKHKNLTIFTREENSKNKITKLFPNCETYLVPDIVLSYSPMIDKYDRKDVLFCTRNDTEKNENSKKLIKNIESLIKSYNYKINYTDTYIPNFKCEYKQQYPYIQEIWNKMAKSKLVVTDRLHGMIFCIITKTPCIALNNSTGKVKSFYKTWLKNSGVVFIDSELDLQNLEKILLENNGCIGDINDIDYIVHFDKLRKKVVDL